MRCVCSLLGANSQPTRPRPAWFIALALWITIGATHVRAAVIVYEVIDLPDIAIEPFIDHWQYRYHIRDASFNTGEGFSVFFVVGQYENLEDPPPAVNGDWDVRSFQPDPLLPDNGFYDAAAMTDNPSLADPFVVTFVWLDSGIPGNPGIPGAQPFEIFDANFNVIETGQTVPIPEPASWMIVTVLGLTRFTSWRSRS